MDKALRACCRTSERRSGVLREDDIQSVLGFFVAENFSEAPHGGQAILAQIVASKPLSPFFLHPILLVPDWSPSLKIVMTHKLSQ
jgi:hypothetical protein